MRSPPAAFAGMLPCAIDGRKLVSSFILRGNVCRLVSAARRRSIAPRAALRVGAVNGDSRADRPRGLQYDPPLWPEGIESPFIAPACRKRFKSESRAREAFVDAVKAKDPYRDWSGAVSAGPAAMLLHTLRARWIERIRIAELGKPPLPLTDDIKALYTKLIQEIRLCDQAYYAPEPKSRIRDEEYDELVMHLLELERVFPELTVPDSPSKVVGHSAAVPRGEHILTPMSLATAFAQRFPPHRHATRMLSLANAYGPDDVVSFINRAENFLVSNDISTTDHGLEIENNCAPDAGDGQRLKHGEDSQLAKLSCCVEVKVDGVALSLSYRKGKLVAAATRGDGIIGDCVTDNVRAALVGRGVLEELPEPLDVDVRGEVYIRPSEFKALSMEEQGRLTNPRNAAFGGLKHKDPLESAKRMLRFVAYEALKVPKDADERPEKHDGEWIPGEMDASHLISTQLDTLKLLSELGFDAMPIYKLCETVDEIQSFATSVEQRRPALPFEADGVVIKINNSRVRDALGSTAKAPRGAVALKFASVGSQTKITSVSMQVSRRGVITPVANLEPVTIGGVRVARATLHNFDEIKRLGVAVNDTVIVQRGGDVIPKITKLLTPASSQDRINILIPEICPSCRGPVKVRNQKGSTVVICNNSEQCSAQTIGRLRHFCSRDAMDIGGMGIKTAVKLLEHGFVVSPADLFTLTVETIMLLPNFKYKSATSLHAAIADAATNRSLERLIIAIGIPGVGRTSARALANHAETIEGLLRLGAGTATELLSLPNVAEKAAGMIRNFLSDSRTIEELQRLSKFVTFRRVVDGQIESYSDLSVNSTGAPGNTDEIDPDGVVVSNELTGKTFAFTGKMRNVARRDALQKVRERGGKIVTIVSKRTDFVVAGAEPGVKFQKARLLGVRVLTEEDFDELMQTVDPIIEQSSEATNVEITS